MIHLLKKYFHIFLCVVFFINPIHTNTTQEKTHCPLHCTEQDDLLTKGFGINFHRGMRSCPTYSAKKTEAETDWHLIKFLYDTHIVHFDCTQTRTIRIPKKIHQIWLDQNDVPEKYKILQESWQKQHPDWHYMLWKTEDIAALDLINKAAYEAATTTQEKEEIAKYEILYKFGGVYAELSCECLKPFDCLHYACDFYASIAPHKHLLISDSIIGATPNNAIIGISIEAMRRMSLKQENFSLEHFMHAFTAAFKSFVLFTHERSVILPLSYLDPWPRTEENLPDIYRKRFYTKMSFAIKHWSMCNE